MVLELIPKENVGGNEGQKKPADSLAYTGPERRKVQRRERVDRREMVRFQVNTDRRGGKERRNTLGLWKNRDF